MNYNIFKPRIFLFWLILLPFLLSCVSWLRWISVTGVESTYCQPLRPRLQHWWTQTIKYQPPGDTSLKHCPTAPRGWDLVSVYVFWWGCWGSNMPMCLSVFQMWSPNYDLNGCNRLDAFPHRFCDRVKSTVNEEEIIYSVQSKASMLFYHCSVYLTG